MSLVRLAPPGACLKQIGSAASSTESEIRKLGQSLKNAAQNVLALVGHCKTIGAMKDFVRRGAEFNSYMESGRIGIASLITSMVNLEDAQGRTLEGAEKYAAAQGLAADMMKEIQRLGLETTATAQELVEGVQSVMGPAVQAGLKLSEIPAFAVAAAQAMQAMGIPLDQMRTEIEALLTGNINRAQDFLAPRLGITGETVESWKAQGTLVENLMKKLEAFQLAGQDAAQTWKGLTGNLSEAMDVLAGQSSMGLSESLKQSVREIRELVIDTREGSVGISGNFEHIAELLMEIEGEIGGGILFAVKSLVEGVKEFNQYLGDTGVTEVLDNVESAVMSAGAAFLALKVSRYACNSEMLQGIKADISAQGVFGSLAQKIREADAALQKKMATERAAAASQAAATARTAAQAASLNTLTLRARAAAVTLAGLRVALNGLSAFFGGPWGVALTVGATALGYLATKESEAEKINKTYAASLSTAEEALKKVKETADGTTESVENLSVAQARLSLKKAQEDYERLMQSMTLLVDSMVVSASSFGKEIDPLIVEFNKFLVALRDGNADFVQTALKLDELSEANPELAAKLQENVKAFERLAVAIKNNERRIEGSTDATEKQADRAKQAAAAENDLATALDAVNTAEQKAPQSAGEAAEWLLKRTAQSETMKKALEEEAKGYDTLALAILNSAAAQAMADLEAQTNRLTMTDEQFREWELTNRTLPKLREELKGAADAAQRLEKFEQATRSNWAKEDEEKAQEKARENLQIQADFYEQLREKSGRYGAGLEYVNKLIEQQAQAWKEAGIPEEYRKQLAEILRLEASTYGWDGARRAMRSYYADSMNMGRQFENFTSSTLSGLEDAFVDFAMTGKLGFSDLANSIISDLVRIAYQAMVVAPLLEGLAGGKSGGGGLLGGLIGGLLGGGSSAGASMSVSGGLASGGWSPSSVFGWAKGGVFSGGNISDYSGSIVAQPTAFSFGRHLSMFAGGGGIMGEAGPEAILPLDRASNGRLGLAVSGMDGIMQQAQRGFAAESAKYMKFIAEQRQTMKPQITVNVINKTGQQVQAQTTAAPDGQGGMNMEIVLTQIEAGIVQRDAAGKSQLVNHLDRTRGLSRAGRLYR